MSVDDNGGVFQASPDPLFERLSTRLQGIKLGEKGDFHTVLEPILSDDKIFAVNLYKAGLGEKVEGMFAQFVAGVGAVREILHNAVNA